MRNTWALTLLLGMVACNLAKVQEPSSLVQPVASLPDRAPSDRALVFFHRELHGSGQRFPVNVWDGPTFLGELKSGHGCFRVCEPGQHYFVSRSQARVGVVEANLLPGKVYDIMFERKWGWDTVDSVVSPVSKDDKRRSDIPTMLAELSYYEPKPEDYVREYETAQRPEVLRIIEEFTKGEKQYRLQRLEADDHR